MKNKLVKQIIKKELKYQVENDWVYKITTDPKWLRDQWNSPETVEFDRILIDFLKFHRVCLNEDLKAKLT